MRAMLAIRFRSTIPLAALLALVAGKAGAQEPAPKTPAAPSPPAGAPEPPAPTPQPALGPSPLTAQANAAPASPPSPTSACFPACREGFICTSDARCVSMCNPPCPADQSCIDGRRCDYPAAALAVPEPPPPPRVGFAHRAHSMLAFHYGFSSSVEVSDDEGPTSSVLGVNARTDMPVAKYLLIGPMLEFGAYEPAYYLDLDITLRARIPIDVGETQFQFWAGMPIGLTFSFLTEDFARDYTPDLDAFALGWNIGVLAGGAVHFSREFGLFGEFGWQEHTMSHARGEAGSVELVLAPWVLNVGFVFRG